MDIPSLVARIISEDPDDNHPDPSEMTPEQIFYYAINKLNRKPWPEAEPYIMKDPEWAYKYVNNILHKPWPEAEPYIAKNPQYAYNYAANILYEKRFLEAEPYIAKDPHWAYWYAKNILHRPWPEAEPYIIKNPKYASNYANYILKRSWPEAEPIIKKDPWAACEYAKRALRGKRFFEAEPYIIKGAPPVIYSYIIDILHGKRWPEAEPYIMKNPEYAYKYAANVLGERWPEAEPHIMKDPVWAYKYAANVLDGKRWPEAEPYIIKNPKYAYIYARDILHGERWPEAEPYIMRDPTHAYLYAKDVLHGERWPEAEQYIKKDPEYAYYYIKDIIKEPWPEAEPYLKKNPGIWWKYKQLLRKLEGKDLNKQVNKSKFFKHGYKTFYSFTKIPGKIAKKGELFTLLISSLEPDVEKTIPEELYSLFDLHYIGSKNKLDKFIGWIGGAITDDAVWVQEIQSDLLQRTWQLQSKEKFLNKKNKQLEKKKELLNQLQDELNKLLNYYQYPPLSKAYGLDEKIEHLKQEQKRLKKEIENIERNKNLKFYPQYAQFKSKLENLYLKWIEAFYHIVIWYAKKFDKDELYIIPSETVANLWGKDVGGEGSVYYRAYDGIAKKLGAKLVTIDSEKWWLLELNSFTPMESKNYQR